MGFFKKLKQRITRTVRQMKSTFDEGGSYTGTPAKQNDKRPEQDADDL